MTRIPYSALPDAGLWRRLAAGLYDGFLLAALWFVVIGIAIPLYVHSGAPVVVERGIETAPPLVRLTALPLLMLAVTWMFYGWFWRHGGQTLGMRAWRLRLVADDGRQLTARDGLARSALATLSLLAGLAGYLWLLADREGRTWHDRRSRTRVVLLPKDST